MSMTTIHMFAVALRLLIPASELRWVLSASSTFGSNIRFVV
jgi:hypothetical protein